ncbi:MAG: cytochrome C [Hyphomicrobiaceae bacterium]
MKRQAQVILSLGLMMLAGLCSAWAGDTDLPFWAYPDTPTKPPVPVDDGQMRMLPESSKQFSFAELRDFFSPPDWYPEDHPPMPSLVAHGAKPKVYACGYCHLPTGMGRPENAPIAGLPAKYILKQVHEMKSGARKSSLPEHYPQALMWELAAQAATDPGLEEAAAYFASIKPKQFMKVVETDTIPKVEVMHWIYKKADSGGTEPLGNRLIELTDDFARFGKRDGRITYTVYVPPGSLAKGEDLVKTGGGKTTACATCHGGDLKGLGLVPPIAGRSPSYIARQLHDFRTGARSGDYSELMKPVVANLTNDDIIAITGYLASLNP